MGLKIEDDLPKVKWAEYARLKNKIDPREVVPALGETTVSIDQDKIADDARLDGLKGYVTNSKIRNKAIVENYRNLYFIERAFRMNKTDLPRACMR